MIWQEIGALENAEIVSIGVGCLVFGSSLAISTIVQSKFLGISTGTIKPIPSLCGMVTVAMASLVSENTALSFHEKISNSGSKRGGKVKSPSQNQILIGGRAISKHAVRTVCYGLIAFKLLGGRFWAISPSSYTHLGSFARVSIPATSSYATQAERDLVTRVGRLWGCHTCGSRIFLRRNVIADHQPPKAVAEQMNNHFWRKLTGIKVKYRFYPQCLKCSNKQGSILSSAVRKSSSWFGRPQLSGAGGGRMAHCHALKFRFNHLTGSLLTAITMNRDRSDSE